MTRFSETRQSKWERAFGCVRERDSSEKRVYTHTHTHTHSLTHSLTHIHTLTLREKEKREKS